MHVTSLERLNRWYLACHLLFLLMDKLAIGENKDCSYTSFSGTKWNIQLSDNVTGYPFKTGSDRINT